MRANLLLQYYLSIILAIMRAAMFTNIITRSPLPVRLAQSQTRLKKISSLNFLQTKILFSVGLSTLFLCLTESIWFATASYAQPSISLPSLGRSEPPAPAVENSEENVSTPPSDRSLLNIPNKTYFPNIPPVGDLNTRESFNSSEQFNEYRLDTTDNINISVPNFPEFSGTAIIDTEGNANIPILGRISLAGLTLKEVENKISYELQRKYLQEAPQVNVILTTARPADIAVLGEVSKPGFYGLTTGVPLVAALVSAGGSNSNADLRSVVIRRTLVDGTQIEKKVDLYTPLITAQKPPLVRLQGGDTIVVPKLEVGNSQNYDRTLVARSTLPKPTMTVRVLSPSSTGVAFRNISLPNGSTFLDVIASLPPNDPLLVDDEVALMRFAPEKGGISSQKLNTEAAINGDLAQNIPLQDEDTIVVSRTLLGKIFNAFDVITQPIRSVFGFRSFFDNLFD
jgi:polysaccharide export outer membrane protein